MAVPVILAGKAEPVAPGAIKALEPEVDVVHFVFLRDASREIPIVSRNEIPDPRNGLGTGDWSNPPKAVVFTGAYEDSVIDQLRKETTAAGGQGAKYLPWLRPDPSIPSPGPGPELVKLLVGRCKEALKKLDAEGKLVPGGEVDFYY